MTVRGFLHVNVEVAEVEAARVFYRDVLGLEELHRAEGAQRAGAWFRVGEMEIHLSEAAGMSETSSRHFAIEVSGLAEHRAALERAGATIAEGRPLPGIKRFFTRDPSGNLIELQELAAR